MKRSGNRHRRDPAALTGVQSQLIASLHLHIVTIISNSDHELGSNSDVIIDSDACLSNHMMLEMLATTNNDVRVKPLRHLRQSCQVSPRQELEQVIQDREQFRVVRRPVIR